MPRYLTCEYDPDFPIPNAARVAARVKELSANGRPALLYDIARSFDSGSGAIECVLRRAERNGLVQCVGRSGWIATWGSQHVTVEFSVDYGCALGDYRAAYKAKGEA